MIFRCLGTYKCNFSYFLFNVICYKISNLSNVTRCVIFISDKVEYRQRTELEKFHHRSYIVILNHSGS